MSYRQRRKREGRRRPRRRRLLLIRPEQLTTFFEALAPMYSAEYDHAWRNPLRHTMTLLK